MKEATKNNKYSPGDVVTLKVARTSELGAFLDAGTGNTNDDILLHKAQQLEGWEASVGEEVTVYLYLDPKGRLTASRRLPKMQEGQVARTKVINISRDGAFVDIGAERGVFMPFSEMLGRVKRGDKVWAKLYRDKSGRQAVTMQVDEELKKAAKNAETAKIGDLVTGSVYNITEQGAFLFTNERYIAFLHNDESIKKLRLGEEVTARISFIRQDGRINVSMRPLKEKAIEIDAAKILEALNSRGGQMPYGDDTPAQVIKEKFQISKSSFKRALGFLLKKGLVEQKDGWTSLTGQN